jgi:serine/threonine-protein kinase
MDQGQAGSLVGHSIGPYHVLDLIGEGGMGAVYRARDERLDRIVALKTLLVQHAAEPDLVQRMHIEARAASALSHPNICTIFDIGEWDGRPYIVMEFLEGEALRDRIQGQPLPLDDVLRFGVQLAAALEAAHAKRIIHRDVKPANLLLPDRQSDIVKVADFGVAKLSGAEPLTQEGAVVGTLGYLSPEQAAGKPIDARTDVYALAVTWYRLLTGRAPFSGTPAELLAAAFRGPLPDPSLVEPRVPARIAALVQRMSALSASDRPADGNATAHEIEAATRAEIDAASRDGSAGSGSPT